MIESVLKDSREFEMLPAKQELLKLKESGTLVWPDIDGLVSGNFLRTLPGVHPCDGFFAGILQKNE